MDLYRLFHPRSIAVVGASARMGGGKLPYFQILRFAGYPGPLYPVNPAHEEIDGVQVYPTLDAVPETVDLAILSVPARLALETTQMAARRGIPFLHFFTSGFSEIGRKDLEGSLVAAARRGNTRIVGPNCIGIHCSESKVTFDPSLLCEGRGEVAFLGQSGGITNNVTRMLSTRGIGVDMAVSYGNQIDITIEDFLEYFAGEDPIRAVAAYVEDLKDGRAFLRALSRVVATKPVVILKGGVTAEGARAATSHTGALAGRQEIWSAAMRQYRVIEVETQKQMVDVTLMATSRKIPRGPRVAYLGAGGGTAVLFTDLAVQAGLALPELSGAVQRVLQEKIPEVNTSTANPVDLGAFGFDPGVMTHAMRAVDGEDRIDAIVLYLTLDLLSVFETERVQSGLRAIASAAEGLGKPVVTVLEKAAENDLRLEELKTLSSTIFRGAGLPLYHTLEDAVGSMSAILRWSRDYLPREGGEKRYSITSPSFTS